jgi:predicted nucleic acid-binding protein
VKLLCDTTLLVDLERQREPVIRFLEEAQRKGHELWISTVTVSEIFTGAYLRKDADAAATRARDALGQFQWRDLDGEAALRAGQIMAHLIAHGRRVEYQDVAIAACAIAEGCDAVITENRDHFEPIPPLAGRVWTVSEAAARIKKRA